MFYTLLITYPLYSQEEVRGGGREKAEKGGKERLMINNSIKKAVSMSFIKHNLLNLCNSLPRRYRI